ncbi:ATP-binding protein [Exiguobacterium sp. AT1b]|uniref:Uncharacterized protein n=1 Tax=Exiguobacterium sp. (strain ATCC BAA-1283 / AT1b) TaxID=360911 RepID=C4L4F4_EXISA|nr:ATP-binding protein [Exiguobacterium sp. AT1b]ACQ71517.1 hypothetical protein EAT1b_2601 [Exiguobacterium sp. AT1b]
MNEITEVTLTVTEGVFKGLAKQNLLFHQCIIELTDNAIAASIPNNSFHIDIQLLKTEESDELIDLYIGDRGRGMNIEVLSKALQLGKSATEDNRLNEHGFGLKNALATLTGGHRKFKIWTTSNKNEVHSVDGPFRHQMQIITKNTCMPDIPKLGNDYSTIIFAQVSREFLKTLQGRGAKTQNLSPLRLWLIEHLGVTYRGYLNINQDTGLPYGNIFVYIDEDRKRVPSIKLPLANGYTERFNIELDGIEYELLYRYGTLDKYETRKMLFGGKLKYYYQGNQSTQGIDIQLGKRTIATRQFENIWRRQTKNLELLDEPISRHNSYNDFIGELIIPDLPRNVLTTVNNKTDFNLDDPDWIKIFNKLNEFRPIKNVRETTEKELVAKLADRIVSIPSGDSVSTETSVWYSGTQIDLYHKKKSGEIIIYEVKIGKGAPLDVYQLKMYWDGLLNEGVQPDEGYLLVESKDSNLERMVDDINKLFSPMAPRNTTQHKPYNLKIITHHEIGLDR